MINISILFKLGLISVQRKQISSRINENPRMDQNLIVLCTQIEFSQIYDNKYPKQLDPVNLQSNQSQETSRKFRKANRKQVKDFVQLEIEGYPRIIIYINLTRKNN
ncbi:hypothetical protein RF11_01302 [Thelohanellus kitauei]|uniref:Uncharacterized protein n=1 Tax=Thelohanellus kitauei TaxID=669202 RepID=A0A0C2JC68_THEKT|nr:hypothetical protein RF11_01302 [Thelohanellus kitauei]